jgi:PKD repeat protein
VSLTATNAVGTDTETKLGYIHVSEPVSHNSGHFGLAPNRPNPFSTRTEISYYLPSTGHVRLEVFGLEGKSVAVLIDADRNSGSQTTSWEPRGCSAGVYLLRLSWENHVQTRRIMYVK